MGSKAWQVLTLRLDGNQYCQALTRNNVNVTKQVLTCNSVNVKQVLT